MSVDDFRTPPFAPIVETLAKEITSGRNLDLELENLLLEECPSDCADECCVEPTPPALDEQEAEDAFDEFLNEVHPVVSICGYDYDAARAFKEIDPIAYRVDFLNWVDSQETDGINTFPWNQ